MVYSQSFSSFICCLNCHCTQVHVRVPRAKVQIEVHIFKFINILKLHIKATIGNIKYGLSSILVSIFTKTQRFRFELILHGRLRFLCQNVMLKELPNFSDFLPCPQPLFYPPGLYLYLFILVTCGS